MTEDRFRIRPILSDDLEHVSSACWENRETQLRLLEEQDILGMGAWDGARCVGQLHCYRVTLPEWDESNFPGYGRARPVTWPLGWLLLAAVEKGLAFDRPAWGHACYHVGFTNPSKPGADRSYFGRGIGTALCRASVEWARNHGYAAVLAQGGPKAVFDYNLMMGCLPWTTYATMGFECLGQEEDGEALPWWVRESKPSSDRRRQVEEALGAGYGTKDICARLMVLQL